MKKNICRVLIITAALIFVLSACGNNAEEREPDWNACYSKVLNEEKAEHENHYSDCEYTLYDIENDGIPEMFLNINAHETSSEYHIYSCVKGSDKAEEKAYLPGGNTYICKGTEDGTFLEWYSHMGYEQVFKDKIEDGQVVKEALAKGVNINVMDQYNLERLTFYDIDDDSGLLWEKN